MYTDSLMLPFQLPSQRPSGAWRPAAAPGFAGLRAVRARSPQAALPVAYVRPDELPHDERVRAADRQLRAHVLEARFPCVAARSAFNQGNYRFGLLPALGDPRATTALWAGLKAFSDEFEVLSPALVSYAAVFDGPHGTDEQTFESLLWRQLQDLHLLDARHHGWAPGVSADPADSDFSFSVAGRAFFVVGMHAQASRRARRTPRPTLVFNFHEQFEALRERGKYEGMKATIRRRELSLQGSINPVLAGFGESSEARQYAGRAVAADWTCPFHPTPGSTAQAEEGPGPARRDAVAGPDTKRQRGARS